MDFIDIRLVLVCSGLFLISEILLAIRKRSAKLEREKSGDRLSLFVLWLAITGGITAGFFLARYAPWEPRHRMQAIAGILIALAGEIIRWMAIRKLKEGFTVDVSIMHGHKLITDGIYRYVRHPSYTGLLLVCVGLASGMNSIWSLFATVIPVYLAIRYRIYVEEKLLIEKFGEAYLRYREKTARLIPGLPMI